MPPALSSENSSRRETDAPGPSFDDRRVGLRANLINIAAAMLVAVIVTVALKELATVLRPLFIAIFLFYIADPAVDFLTRRKIPYSIAYLVVLGGFAGLAYAGISGLSDRAGDLAHRLPELQNRVQIMAASAASSADDAAAGSPFLRRQVRLAIGRLDLVKPLAAASTALVTQLPGVLWDALLVAIYVAFLIQERRALPARLVSIYGRERAARIGAISERINKSIARYLYIKFLASAIKAVACGVIMGVMGLDFAVVWAAIIFVANFIPYLGSILSFSLPIGVAVMQFSGAKAVGMAAALFGIEFLIGNYWEPKVSGHRLNLSPVVIVLALAFWGWLWGVTGMLLAVPITVSIRFILENIPYTRPLATLLSHHAEPEPARS